MTYEADIAQHYAGVRKRLFNTPKPVVQRVWPVAPAPEPAPYDEWPKPGRETSWTILAEVCAKHRVSVADVLSVDRRRSVVAARHEAMYRIKQDIPRLSFPQIGRVFGRDHSTVMAGYRRHEAKVLAGVSG